MIRPVNFGFNAETAVNNAFQSASEGDDAQKQARKEFDRFVQILTHEGVNVLTVDDSPEPYTPDSIFPNNWVSFHQEGEVFLYPMFAPNRRLERKPAVLEMIKNSFSVKQLTDLSDYEKEARFLEGTGSMVLDNHHKIAYACLSERTDKGLLEEWCGMAGYKAMPFTATDQRGQDIYHTNVMMCVAENYVVICLDSIKDPEDKKRVSQLIRQTGKTIIEISLDQMNSFAGNMLQVNNQVGEKLLVMSTQAYASLEAWQLKQLYQWNRIVHAPLDTIETNGGGSARCMMAEVHLPLLAKDS